MTAAAAAIQQASALLDRAQASAAGKHLRGEDLRAARIVIDDDDAMTRINDAAARLQQAAQAADTNTAALDADAAVLDSDEGDD